MFFQFNIINAQVTLDADGPNGVETYNLISSVLAPGYDAVEEPDCSHTPEVKHIDEIMDAATSAGGLGINVFRFTIHALTDTDRCNGSTDRQRNEIKTYDKSPDNLKGISGETVVYKWKFKLPDGFQSSSSFTHIHQLKSVGGLYESMPMYTLTTRKGTPDKLEIRYAETASQITLISTDLAPFKGSWVDVTETIKFGTNASPNSGTYSILINKVSDGTELLNYSNNSIKNWQTDADFVRPKWGIYRSLNSVADLRDEEVLFANFSIEENPTLSVIKLENKNNLIRIFPNPSNNEVHIQETIPNSFNYINILDNLGRIIRSQNSSSKTISISNLKKGLYFIELKKDSNTICIEKVLIN